MQTDDTALYLRISQDRTGTALGVERQEEDGRALAQRRGFTVTVYRDNDESAKKAGTRPDFNRLLKDIESGRIKTVVAWSWERLTRNRRESVHLIETCKDNGVLIVLVKGSDIDCSTAAGRLVADMLSGMAQNEIDVKSERQKRKVEQLVSKGLPLGGGRPFGYESDGMTIRKDEARELKAMVRKVIKGESLASIMRDLNERGVKTTRDGAWNYSSLRSVLTRPRNAGLMQHHGEVVGKAAWKPIVTEAEHATVLSVLSDPKRRTTTGNNRKHLLSGLVVCGVCEKPMKAGAVRSRGVRYEMYRCCVHRNRSKVDDHVNKVVVMLIDDIRLQHALAKREDIDLGSLESRRDEIQTMLQETASAYAKKVITMSQLTTITEELNTELEGITSALNDAHRGSPFEDLIGSVDMRKRWDELDLLKKRKVIDALLTVKVLPVGKKGRGPQPITKSVEVTIKGTQSRIIGTRLTDELQRTILSAF